MSLATSSTPEDMETPESLAQLQNIGPELDSLNFDNMTSIDEVVEKLMDSDLLTFFFSLFCTIFWVVYITFYSSRITGLLVTKVVNHFFKDGYIKIGKKSIFKRKAEVYLMQMKNITSFFSGSLSFSVLSGKIMFRDVSYITEDCSYRVQDGWIIFRWWRTYVPKDISEGKMQRRFDSWF
jgi:hypothetical protein